MGILGDIAPLFKKRELALVEVYQEFDDIYTFIFKKEQNLSWKAGQHGVFTILHKKINKPTRPFTLASAPSENIVKISMRIGENPSEFKKAMLELEQGMKISMRGPIGPLYINDDHPSLLVAGGIGITPFRAMLKEAEHHPNRTAPLELLYISRGENFLYKDELAEIAKTTSIQVNFLNAREDLYQGIDEFITMHKHNGRFYVAGEKTMVDSVATYLKNKNIAKSQIKKDVFIGYK
ncbi:FAD-dependent oxidoreductase [Bacillus rubiinfantis]|uniref:FAD-dependent oxidoreductase n=1 Tax=Bacillus rubiinfantis TaxID=1499680 RepID=UPI0005A82BB7|nr:FAD-dependent oxidoreductase [Bacillus rubiinfantis]